jgi:hypothetical protein
VADVDATVKQIEELLEELRRSDPEARRRTEEIVRLLMELYGAGLARTIEMLGGETVERLAEDRLISSLLLLHGLHPLPAPKRIQRALRRVERGLAGIHLEVGEISEERVQVRVNWNGVSRPPATLATLIEHAVAESAPDAGRVEIEGLPEAALVQIAPASR